MKLLRSALASVVLLAIAGGPATAQEPSSDEWSATVEAAKGQTVYFNAWGGSQNINDYIQWVADEVSERYDITLEHVKLEDTANAVAQVLAEKAAGRNEDGGIDLIWINGENFASMKEQGLLADGFATDLPNWSLVDADNPSVTTDFTVPTDGRESPWGGAKFVFFTDPARFGDLDTMPRTADELLQWAKDHPGRFSYPAPPDFMGSSFLKQILSEKIADPSLLQEPVDEAKFEEAARPLWDYLDALQPVLWRSGRDYPQNYPAMKQLLADGELGIIFAFNPAEASSAIANFELPDTVRSFVFPGGTLGNTHFVAIPYNSGSKPAAKVVADFLLSPEAQLRKERPEIWGDPTVLDMEKLEPADRQAFEAIDRGVATLGPDELGPVLPEPHPSWMTRIEEEWKARYGS
ncbi:ABC transporter substrate-binding protein [Fulvimarina endophytica]|uniref:ABC transporter substrate-binding protein n=1 Tax=Fulvimarina endophytica TaxID=2293836 RepID=A0A371X2I4_9HYPH|nr:ABC transporter substrate-binding protein [Fulvimarina endophytica]RFC63426.1 ABC transporter substrate-binding protein [Fulvimarina endophytica]